MRPEPRRRSVAVIGGGASGVLTAVHLLRSCDDPALRVVVHETSGRPARGIAYSTTDARHLLNVRTRDMSALPDEPGHLVDWVEREGLAVEPHGFLPRQHYRRYLLDLLRQADDGRLVLRAGEVQSVAPDGPGFVTTTASGVQEHADAVVLAHGNQPPRALAGVDGPLPRAPWHLPDPWDLPALERVPADATVVLVGSGLTAVDTAITLLEGRPGRRVVMLSRHGLLPAAHTELPSETGWVTPVPAGDLTADALRRLVEGQVRAAAAQGIDWRPVVDGLRPATQTLWQRLDHQQQARFLAEHARAWEVRRHRMAPQVAALVDRHRDAGRLELRAGRLETVLPEDGGCRVTASDGSTVRAHAVVNCTGPLGDVTASRDPLLQDLLRRGLVAPDRHRLGLACTSGGAVLDGDGREVAGLFTLGPPRKGTLYETTAVPEIRTQAAELAPVLAAAAGAAGGGAPRPTSAPA
jgi:uncharacterized NAD(P)/FAD-binding protein YdhS